MFNFKLFRIIPDGTELQIVLFSNWEWAIVIRCKSGYWDVIGKR